MRLRTILAAAAAPAALAAVLLGTAGQASAATTTHTAALTAAKTPGTITCGSPDGGQWGLGGDSPNGPIKANVDVPAGQYCSLGVEVTGNVSVEGVLSSSGSTFDKNVNVSGPGSKLQFFNNPSEIKGNLTITGSSGAPNGNIHGTGTSFFTNSEQGGAPRIDGNFTFTGNTGDLNVVKPMTVAGNFTATGNGPYDMPWEFNSAALTVLGQQNIS
jgi:hypothetical protein